MNASRQPAYGLSRSPKSGYVPECMPEPEVLPTWQGKQPMKRSGTRAVELNRQPVSAPSLMFVLMGRTTEWFTTHSVHDQIAAAKSEIEAFSEEEAAALTEQGEADLLPRAASALDYCAGPLSVADPQLSSDEELSELGRVAGAVAQTAATVRGDPSQAVSLEQAIDGVIHASVPFAARGQIPPRAAQEIEDKLGQALRTRLQELAAEAAAIGDRIEALDSRRAELADQTEQADAARRSELQGRMDQLASAVEAEKQRLDGLVPEFETRFEEAQGSRREDWDTLRAELETKVDEARTELQTRATETQTELQEKAEATASSLSGRADQLLEYLEGKKSEFEDLYRVLVDTGVSGGFNEEAREQQEVANTWRLGAVLGGVATTVLAVAAVAFAAAADEALGTHIAAVGVAVAAGGITAYAARQSGHHRDREVESKRLALELAAFGPFVEGFVEEAEGEASVSKRANDARKDYIDRMFKGAERASPHGEQTVISKDQISLVQSLIEAVLKVRGS